MQSNLLPPIDDADPTLEDGLLGKQLAKAALDILMYHRASDAERHVVHVPDSVRLKFHIVSGGRTAKRFRVEGRYNRKLLLRIDGNITDGTGECCYLDGAWVLPFLGFWKLRCNKSGGHNA